MLEVVFTLTLMYDMQGYRLDTMNYLSTFLCWDDVEDCIPSREHCRCTRLNSLLDRGQVTLRY